MRKKVTNFIVTLLLILAFLAGLSLLLYPTVSNYINEMHQTKAIADYSERVARISPEEYDAMLRAAQNYNARLLGRENRFVATVDDKRLYNDLLNPDGNGIMGYIEIPTIDVSLPVYHGTEDNVLQVAVGHLQWSSLPIGGIGTHSVLSGHRGLPSAKLFTHLDELREGDIFLIKVLNETLTYEVDKISVVLPDEVSSLCVMEGEDLCTLVTCTPYGINTHRLLVRGHRVENAKNGGSVHVTADATVIKPLAVFPFAAAPLLLSLVIGLVIYDRQKKKRERRRKRREDHDR